jgi:hypothetical protein
MTRSLAPLRSQPFGQRGGRSGFRSVAAAGAALLLLAALGAAADDGGWIGKARAQAAACTPGQNCCIVAATMESPRRYEVVCDQNGQSAQAVAANSGYTAVFFGPETYERCGAWMAASKIPGWDQYANVRLPSGTVFAKADAGCVTGKSCCYVGGNHDLPPRYAIACDGATGPGSVNLATTGYTSIFYGPASAEACQAWWNDNIARGVGATFPPAPTGAVPFAPGTFAGHGPKPTAECLVGQNCCYVGFKQVLIGPGTTTRTDYAIAYDGAVFAGGISLGMSGYQVIFGPVSIEACHGWWNDNLADKGLASTFPQAPAGAVPFPPGAFLDGGRYDRIAGALAAIAACDFDKAKKAIEALPPGAERDEAAGIYSAAYEREKRTDALWQQANGLVKAGQDEEAQSVLEQALASTACRDYHNRIADAIAGLHPAPKPTVSVTPTRPTPSTPTPPPGPTLDQQCKDLLNRALMTEAGGTFAEAGAALLSGRPDYRQALSAFNDALALFKQGAAKCPQDGYPAKFAQGVQGVTRDIVEISGR